MTLERPEMVEIAEILVGKRAGRLAGRLVGRLAGRLETFGVVPQTTGRTRSN